MVKKALYRKRAYVSTKSLTLFVHIWLKTRHMGLLTCLTVADNDREGLAGGGVVTSGVLRLDERRRRGKGRLVVSVAGFLGLEVVELARCNRVHNLI